MRIEAEKTARACQIARETGLFRVPTIQRFDEQESKIVFERIRGLTRRRMQYLLAYDVRKRVQIVENVGRCLAVIHDRLRLESEFKIVIDDAINWPNEQVFVHGDFDIQNVSCLPDNQIVIIDWQMTRHFGGEASYGTYYLDVAWFMMNLFFIRTRGLRYATSFPTTGLATRFARSYWQTSGRSAEDFGQYFKKFFAATIPAIRPNNRRQRIYMSCLLPFLNRFIARCSIY